MQKPTPVPDRYHSDRRRLNAGDAGRPVVTILGRVGPLKSRVRLPGGGVLLVPNHLLHIVTGGDRAVRTAE